MLDVSVTADRQLVAHPHALAPRGQDYKKLSHQPLFSAGSQLDEVEDKKSHRERESWRKKPHTFPIAFELP